MTLTEAAEHIGEPVVYNCHPEVPSEDGVITSVGEHYVFVRYAGDLTSKATHPSHLTLLADTIKADR